MIKKLYTALYTDKNVLYLNEDSASIVFSCNGIVILKIDLNINNNFGEDDPDTIILVRLLACHIKFETRRELQKVKRRINANSVTSQKMVGFLHVRR